MNNNQKRKKIIITLITLVIFLLVLPTFSYSFRSFVESGFRIEVLNKTYFKNVFLSIDTYKIFFVIADPPNVISWVIIGAFLLIQMVGNQGIFKSHQRYIQKDSYGSHGTSRWQTTKEIEKNYFLDSKGWFMGGVKKNKTYELGAKAAYHSVNGKLNMQTTVIGPPGSAKTTAYVLPNIFHIPYVYKNEEVKPDLIITDPKSELLSITGNYLKKQGYDVHVLDFIHLKYGDSLNVLEFINTEKELIELGDGYIKASVGSLESQVKSGNDSFWNDAESQLLTALIGYTIQKYNNEDNKHLMTLTQVSKLLTSDGVTNPKKAKDFFKKSGITGTAEQLWNNFLMAEDRVRANIMIGLATKLRLFAIEGIQNITNTTTLDVKKIGAKKEKPIALYLLMPASDRTFSPIINVIITVILKQLYKTSYFYNNTLYNPVYLMLEEMANIGKIPGIKEMLGTMRAIKVYPMMIWQSLAQMKDRYGDNGMNDILSQCDTHIYLGVNDDFTANSCSKSLGTTTIKVQGSSSKKEGIFGKNSPTESLNYHSRKLLDPNECKKLDFSKTIVIQGHRQPAILEKMQYKHWDEDNLICKPLSVFDIPLIPKTDKVDIETDILGDDKFLKEYRDMELDKLDDLENKSDRDNYDVAEINVKDENLKTEKKKDIEFEF